MSPTDAPGPPSPRPPGGLATAGAGCGGALLACGAAIVIALGPRSAMLALPFAALALLGISIARIRGAAGRALAARVALGLVLGALFAAAVVAGLGSWRMPE